MAKRKTVVTDNSVLNLNLKYKNNQEKTLNY